MSFNNFSLIEKLQSSRARTAYNTLKINSEFSFKDKDKLDSFNNSFKGKNKKMNQTTGNFRVKIKVNKSLQGIQNVVDKYTSLKSSYKSLNRLSQSELEHEKRKEGEIDQLNECIQECSQTNDQIKYEISLEHKERSDLEKEQRNLSDYCNDLKLKFANIEKTIEDYEAIVSRTMNENLELQDGYDKKIDEIERENRRLLERLGDRVRIVQVQKDNIWNLEIKTEMELRDMEDEKNMYMERQTINRIKYDELEGKYSNIQKKIFEFEMNDTVRRAEMVSSTKRISSSRVVTGDLEGRIAEYEKKNNALLKTIRDMSTQLSEIQTRESSRSVDRYSVGKRSDRTLSAKDRK